MGYVPPFPPRSGDTMESVILGLEVRIRQLEERVLLLEPDLTKYPSLANAYKEYKFIERLTLGNGET